MPRGPSNFVAANFFSNLLFCNPSPVQVNYTSLTNLPPFIDGMSNRDPLGLGISSIFLEVPLLEVSFVLIFAWKI